MRRKTIEKFGRRWVQLWVEDDALRRLDGERVGEAWLRLFRVEMPESAFADKVEDLVDCVTLRFGDRLVLHGPDGSVIYVAEDGEGRLLEVDWPVVPFPLMRSLIIVGRRGSEAHGTYVPSTDPDSIDDRDLFGVCIPPDSYYHGLDRWEHAEEIRGQWDVVLDEVRKFARLLCEQNPNVLQALYLEPEDYLWLTPAGRLLIENRELFRCHDKAVRSFIGYAQGQLKKMTSFGKFNGYMGAKRKALVEKHGFDTKNAAHLLRILWTGEEYIRTGAMRVRRPPNEVARLLDVKHGRVSLSEVQALADEAFAMVHGAGESGQLPEQCNIKRINDTLRLVFEMHRRGGGQ